MVFPNRFQFPFASTQRLSNTSPYLYLHSFFSLHTSFVKQDAIFVFVFFFASKNHLSNTSPYLYLCLYSYLPPLTICVSLYLYLICICLHTSFVKYVAIFVFVFAFHFTSTHIGTISLYLFLPPCTICLILINLQIGQAGKQLWQL